MNSYSCPCISSPEFLLGDSEYVFGRGNIFPLLTHAVGIFSPVTDFPILLLNAACSWCSVLFLTLSCICLLDGCTSWALWGPPCKLVTIMCMWHYSRDEEMGENDTVILRLNAQAWEGTNGFWIMQSQGKVSFQESPPAASDFFLSSTWGICWSLLRTPTNWNLWGQCRRIWAMVNQKIKLGDSRVVSIITSACRKGRYVCGLERGQREASSTSAQFN